MLTLLECALDGWSFTKCVLFVSSEIKMAALTVNKTLEVKQFFNTDEELLNFPFIAFTNQMSGADFALHPRCLP